MQWEKRKLVEYAVLTQDGNVDHVPWREAKRLLGNPPEDVVEIRRVTRYWSDGSLVREDEEILLEVKQ